MNTLYKMLDIDIPIEFRDGLYYCNNTLYRDQLYAKKVYKLQKFVDSIANDTEVIEFINKYEHSHNIIMNEMLNKLTLSHEFKEFVKAKMED